MNLSGNLIHCSCNALNNRDYCFDDTLGHSYDEFENDALFTSAVVSCDDSIIFFSNLDIGYLLLFSVVKHLWECEC